MYYKLNVKHYFCYSKLEKKASGNASSVAGVYKQKFKHVWSFLSLL